MTRGVLFIATGGGDYLKMVKLAAASVVRHNPDMKVHVHTGNSKGLDSRAEKLRMYDVTPFDHTIYLDCDVLVRSDLTPLFDTTSCAPHIGMALDYGPKTCAELLTHRFFVNMVPRPIMRNLENRVPDWAPHFNSGVVVFRKTEDAMFLFGHWLYLWKGREPAQDQLALMESCSRRGVWPSLLPQEWNYQHCITKPEANLVNDKEHIKILHLAGVQKRALYQRAQRAGFLREA